MFKPIKFVVRFRSGGIALLTEDTSAVTDLVATDEQGFLVEAHTDKGVFRHWGEDWIRYNLGESQYDIWNDLNKILGV